MSLANSIFEGNYSTYVFGNSFWHYRELNIDFGQLDICNAKEILNSFVCVDFRILVEKLNVNEGHIFPRPLLQTCRIETTTLCLNTRLRVNKKFQNSHTFY